MANISDIKHRIKSIEQNRQITRAMKLISVSKMRKAITRYENNLLYFEKVRATIKDILTHSRDLKHPYLLHREGNRTAYVVIAGDKGLAGGYNKNVLDLAWSHMQTRKERYVFTVGQVTREYFHKKNQSIDVEFLHSIQNPSLYTARRITSDIVSLYEKNLMDEVLVVFTKIRSTMSQQPMIIKLLPVELDDLLDVNLAFDYSSEISYDPSPKAVLDNLIPQYIVGLVYALLVQSAASEHCMRMLAMGNATKNADEMIETLSLDYNRARQALVTTSLSEIIASSNALTSE